MSEQWPDELSLDDSAGPAAYLSPTGREAMVQDVLAMAYPARKRGWSSQTWVAAAIALACIGGGSASAALLWYGRAPQLEPTVVAAPRATVRRPKVEPRIEAPLVEAPLVEAPPVEAPLVEPAPHHTVHVAEDWLREGNRLRAARRWKHADEAYGQAAKHAGSDDTAYVAFVASASVRLEHLNDARGALRHYRAALRASAHGALDQEIRLGIADAYRALGDPARERAALETFLRDHPESPLAEQARARLR